jgi:hypothetical protein
MAASDWARAMRSVTGGTKSTVNIDWSTINEDRAVTGPRRAWVGLPDACRSAMLAKWPRWATTGLQSMDMVHDGLIPFGL